MPEKINWTPGENEVCNYHEAFVDGHQLFVFALKHHPNIWMGMIDDKTIGDKAENTKQTEKDQSDLPSWKSGAGHPSSWTACCRNNAETMKRIVARCYRKGELNY